MLKSNKPLSEVHLTFVGLNIFNLCTELLVSSASCKLHALYWVHKSNHQSFFEPDDFIAGR